MEDQASTATLRRPVMDVMRPRPQVAAPREAAPVTSSVPGVPEAVARQIEQPQVEKVVAVEVPATPIEEAKPATPKTPAQPKSAPEPLHEAPKEETPKPPKPTEVPKPKAEEPKAPVKTPKEPSNGAGVVIFLAVVIFLVLVGLAVFAYMQTQQAAETNLPF